MGFIESKSDKKGNNLSLFYEDYGEGQPVILIHGWPLSHKMWEYQIEEIVNAGFRCIVYDRRGFGQSNRPWDGYDYDSLAGDLNRLMENLDLNEAILVGFSMGGGEVARYLGNYGSSRIAKAALISAVTPYMLKTPNNPHGVEKEVFDGFKAEIRKDRMKFFAGFGKLFFNFDNLKDRVSEEHLHFNWGIACSASPKATLDCIDSFGLTDFREDLKNIDVPTLIVHGDADQIVPYEISGKLSHELMNQSTLKVINNAPHGLYFTHKKEFNEILLAFLQE